MAKLLIPVPKASGFYEVDTDTFNDESFPVHVYLEIILQGCKTLLNRGQSKLKSTKGLEGKDKQAAVDARMERLDAAVHDLGKA